jgi:tyrosine-specific transport protein
MVKSKFIPALAVLLGTIIGAGFLGIPYVVSRSGFLVGAVYLLLIAGFIMLTKLYLGEVSLRTQGTHQLTGLADRYLGKTGKFVMFFAMIFGIYSALVAYLIGEGRSISYIIFGNFGNAFVISLLFWSILSVLTYIGLKALKKYEKISMFVVFGLVLLIFVFFIGKINPENLSYINSEKFAPFGIILFSFLAFSSLPEVKRILSGQEKLMKKVIVTGVLLAFLIYLAFCFVVVGVFGQGVQEIATLSLGRFFALLGVTTMFTAFFALSIAIRDMFRFDFKLGRFKGWLLCSFVPLLLFLIISLYKVVSFVQILSIAGIVSGGLTGISVLLMNLRAKKLGNRKPEYSMKISWPIILVLSALFVAAVLLEILR